LKFSKKLRSRNFKLRKNCPIKKPERRITIAIHIEIFDFLNVNIEYVKMKISKKAFKNALYLKNPAPSLERNLLIPSEK
jgi:hypothetical protein